jgi:hypothetical protein
VLFSALSVEYRSKVKGDLVALRDGTEHGPLEDCVWSICNSARQGFHTFLFIHGLPIVDRDPATCSVYPLTAQ